MDYTLTAGAPSLRVGRQRKSVYRNALRDAAVQLANDPDTVGLLAEMGGKATTVSVYQSLLRMAGEAEFEGSIGVHMVNGEVWITRG
jgi:hypothetical protein